LVYLILPVAKGLASHPVNGGNCLISDGVYIGYTRFDENGHNQIYIATPVDDNWKIIQLTDWKHRFYFSGRGTIPQYPPIPRVTITKDQKILIKYRNTYAEPRNGQLALAREQLIAMKPSQFNVLKADDTNHNIPNVHAVNQGPLPPGFTHYMQQEADSPNRDRKPDNPKEPTMIYIAEVKDKE